MNSPFVRLLDRLRRGSGTVLKALTWFFCLGLLAVGWTAILSRISFERELAITDAIAQNENRAIAFEQYVQRTLEVAAVATRYVADRFQRRETLAEFAGSPDRPAIIRPNLIGTGTFLGMAVIDSRGNLVGTSRPGTRPINVAYDQAFRIHVTRDSGALFVGRPVRPPMLSRDVIFLTRRLNNPDGSFGGVVALSIAPEQFSSFYANARTGAQDIVALIGLDGITRARRAGQVSSFGEDMRGTDALRRALREPDGTARAAGIADGEVRYFSRRRLSGYPLFVIYGVPESEILATPAWRARVILTVAALLSLAIIGFAWLLTLLINRNERRSREMALANRRLQEAQRIGQIGDWRYGTADDPLYWSPQIYTLYERDPALGPMSTREFRALLDEEGRTITDRAMERALATGETQEFDFKVRLPSGTEAWHQVVVIPVRDTAGNVTGLHGTTQNISGRKLLDQLQHRLAHMSRIEAMNAMAATLAHELNQPLASAANYLAGTRRNLEAGDAAQTGEGVAAAEQQIHFAADIIRRVREMVGNQPRSFSVFGVRGVIEDALVLLGPSSTRAPSLEIDPRGAAVRADRVQVQQVLINLLRNAMEAAQDQPGARIWITSRPAADAMVEISVADDGPGFRQPLAERFSPLASRDGGMGLGLSISRTIIEAHGGRIWTADRVGGGAIVSFTLPAAQQGRERQ